MTKNTELKNAIDELKKDIRLRIELVRQVKPLLIKLVAIEDELARKEQEVDRLLRVSVNLPADRESLTRLDIPACNDTDGFSREDSAADQAIRSLAKFAQEFDNYVRTFSGELPF